MSNPSAGIRVEQVGGRTVVVKTAPSGPAADRLRTEIAALRAAQHPGVVVLVDTTESPDEVSVRTRYCGSRTLATIGSVTVDRVAGTLAALATTVADLHDLGIRHGRISADHVLIASDGRPVLCGFGDAATGGGGPEPADDVAALGRLLQSVLGPLDDAVPIPTARFGRRGAWSGYQRRALLNLADQATADDPFIRPTARQLATNLRATVPDAVLFDAVPSNAPADPNRLPYDDTPPDDPTTWQRWRDELEARRPGRRATAGLVVATLAVIAVVVFTGRPSTAPEAPIELAHPPVLDAPTATSASTSTTSTSTSTTTTLVQPTGTARAAGCSVVAGRAEPATTADGAPCATELRLEGGVLVVADEQFHVGLERGAAAIGDFACQGSVHAALVDLDHGDIFVFEQWASDTEEATARALANVPQPRRLLAEPTGTGCHRLVVLDEFGIRYVIDPTAEERS